VAPKKIIIAIDGPAGAGKSTTAKRVADILDYLFLDTGAMYRAVTLAAYRRNLSIEDAEAMALLAGESVIDLRMQDGEQRVFLNHLDVTKEIRTPEVTQRIAPVAANAQVRKVLVRKQQQMGKDGGIVAEGRDIGTVVFPHAELKIFMLASLEARADRRVKDLMQVGIQADIEQVMEDIRRRDESDAGRKHGALLQAPDAILIDTSLLTLEEQVQRIVALAYERGA